MHTKLLLSLIIFTTGTTAGCSLAPNSSPPVEPTPASEQAQARADTKPRSDSDQVKERVYAQYREWKGTRYALGGMSRRGIDCSGLVYITYRDQLGIQLPRTTRYQARVGKAIKRSELRAGDLVFFTTGRKVRHVGIYLEDGKFFHASTSKGVTISELNDYYWRDKYRHARRVDLDADHMPMGK